MLSLAPSSLLIGSDLKEISRDSAKQNYHYTSNDIILAVILPLGLSLTSLKGLLYLWLPLAILEAYCSPSLIPPLDVWNLQCSTFC